ncbi:MAG: glycosyl transferase, partial [Chthoniobacterales bacterium]
IGPATLVLGLGQIAPFLLLTAHRRAVFLLALAASFSALALRLIAARRFQQPRAAIVLPPFAIAALLGIQWWGLARYLLGRPPAWKGRAAFSTSR